MSASPNRFSAGSGGWLLALLCVALAGCDAGSSGSAATSGQAPPGGAGSTDAAKTNTAKTNTATEGIAAGTTGAAKATSTAAPSGGAKQSTPRTPTPSLPAGGRVLRRFTGSGNARLGTIVVGSRSVLMWRAQRPPIQIFTSKGFILVRGRAAAGSIQVSRGTYTGTRVATHGGWTVELRARS